jgi:LysM repeat protein
MDQHRYIVQAGDTLQKISTKCMGSSIHWKLLASHNHIENPNALYSGQTIDVPFLDAYSSFKSRIVGNTNKNQYVVSYGDSLWNISAKYLGSPIRWREIARLNKLENHDLIFVGQTLNLPQNDLKVSTKANPDPQTIGPSLARLAMEHRPATKIPVRAFFFVVADEFNPFSGKFVRKVIFPEALQNNPELLKQIINPEKHGFFPRNPSSKVPIGRHVLGMTDSNYISVSTSPKGSPRFGGKPYWIDEWKLKRAGSVIYTAEDIAKDLDRIASKTKNPEFLSYIENIRYKSLVIDKENLIAGPIDPKFIKGGGAKVLTRGMQFVQGIGILISAYDLGRAGYKSYEKETPRPIVAEAVRQVGGWGSAVLGLKIGAAAGAMFGIETGPGALLTAGLGGLFFGAAGYFGADWIADYIYEE